MLNAEQHKIKALLSTILFYILDVEVLLTKLGSYIANLGSNIITLCSYLTKLSIHIF